MRIIFTLKLSETEFGAKFPQEVCARFHANLVVF